MKLLRTILVVLALVLLGAHLSRAGAPLALALAVPVAGIGLLFVRGAWAGWAVRIVLALGALEWLRSLAVHASRRAEAGQPWLRLAVILGAVAALTALAAWLHRPRAAAAAAPAAD
ncbi:MAG TPA: hypothetical protein VLA66_12015 [Thermoanaerobaculia bacterium]|nr:hypothetical protein [Thermoanaerobaculia bacterium]